MNSISYGHTLTVGQLVRLINRLNKAWKLSQYKYGWESSSYIIKKLKQQKPTFQALLLRKYRSAYLVYDPNSGANSSVILGVKLYEKIEMETIELATEYADAYKEYIEAAKDDAEHLPLDSALSVLTQDELIGYAKDFDVTKSESENDYVEAIKLGNQLTKKQLKQFIINEYPKC